MNTWVNNARETHVVKADLAETLPVLGGDVGDVHHGLAIVGVHVENRSVDDSENERKITLRKSFKEKFHF